MPAKVEVALRVLGSGWVNGRQLLDGVQAMAMDVLGRPAAYDNANAAKRNALAAMLGRGGMVFQTMDVDYDENSGHPDPEPGIGKGDHRLWTITEEAVPRPHRAWQEGEAGVLMERAGHPPEVKRRVRFGAGPELAGAALRRTEDRSAPPGAQPECPPAGDLGVASATTPPVSLDGGLERKARLCHTAARKRGRRARPAAPASVAGGSRAQDPLW